MAGTEVSSPMDASLSLGAHKGLDMHFLLYKCQLAATTQYLGRGAVSGLPVCANVNTMGDYIHDFVTRKLSQHPIYNYDTLPA